MTTKTARPRFSLCLFARDSRTDNRLGVLALTAGLLLPLLAGCPGSLEGTFPPPMGSGGSTGSGGMTGAGGSGAPCDAPGTVFKTTCGVMGCHGPQMTTPDLASAGQWTRLVSQVEVISPACVGMNLVNPMKPADGVLLKRLTGTTCGLQMPLDGTAPNQGAIDCITSWVNSLLPP